MIEVAFIVLALIGLIVVVGGIVKLFQDEDAQK